MSVARTTVKNISVLLIGRILSNGLGVFYVAILARYIHPIGMGKIATATSLVSILTLLSSFGLNSLIIRDVAGDRAKASTYMSNVFAIRALLSFFCLIILFAITKFNNYPPDTTLIIYLYGIAFLFDDFTDVNFSIFFAYEKMEYPTAILTGRDLFNFLASLSAIHFGATLIQIVLISAIANLLKFLVSFFIIRWRFLIPKLHIDLKIIKILVINALPFLAYLLLITLSQQLDTFLLSIQRPEEEIGWFSSANNLIITLLLLPGIAMQSIFPVFSKFQSLSKSNLREVYSVSFKLLLMFGVPLFAGILVTANQGIAILYGPGYENTAIALKILAFSLFCIPGYVNGTLLNATGGQNLLATLTGISVLINLLVAILLIPRVGYIGASFAATIPAAIFFLPITIISHHRLDINVPYALIGKVILSSMIMSITAALAINYHVNLFINIFIIAPLIYFVLLFTTRVIVRKDLVAITRIMKRSPSHSTEEILSSN